MFSLDKAEFDYEPYPLCYARDVFDNATYARMCKEYPEVSLFKYRPDLGHKYALSELNNPKNYERYVADHEVWKNFHTWIKSDQFINGTIDFLKKRNIDLGLGDYTIASKRKSGRDSLFSRVTRKPELSARFEFTMMSPDGGHIRPHTDAPNKLITLVLSMVAPGEWDEAWGGGTQVCMPNDRTKVYNHMNKYMEFEDVTVSKSYEFHPNQCLLFIKTYNSWHQVEPTKGPAGAAMRKTLTINIERKA